MRNTPLLRTRRQLGDLKFDFECEAYSRESTKDQGDFRAWM
jgi:hypothetical protein